MLVTVPAAQAPRQAPVSLVLSVRQKNMSKFGDVLFLAFMAVALVGGWPSLTIYVLKSFYRQKWSVSLCCGVVVGIVAALAIGGIASQDLLAHEYPSGGFVAANR